MKVIVVGGYPGSGKSTIFREVLERLLKAGHVFTLRKHDKLITYMESNKGLIVLGTYGKTELFPGTDRFPMNAQPEAVAFLEELNANEQGQHGKEKVVLFEGDRLFNQKMLTFLRKQFELVLCIVKLERKVLEERRNQRSEQNASWRKGRETKVDRLGMSFPVHHWLKNTTEEEFEASVQELLAEVNGEWKSEPVKSAVKDFWR
jgi:hypothetical protein